MATPQSPAIIAAKAAFALAETTYLAAKTEQEAAAANLK